MGWRRTGELLGRRTGRAASLRGEGFFMASPSDTDPSDTLLQVTDLAVEFPVTRGALFKRTVGVLKAVAGVSFDIRRGEVLGLVGESGCGKTTIAKSILKLVRPTRGRIRFRGQDIWAMDRGAEFEFRRHVQAIFQDPYSSLNPRMTVRQIIGEPYVIHEPSMGSDEIRKQVKELLDLCGLPDRIAERYPHEMSGGQRQRVGIARALALRPEFIVCDEAVSALDVSIQAQIINLLGTLKSELGLTYLFISHDLGVVKHLCDRVAVMYLGRIAELAGSEPLFAKPLHPYTSALMDAVPVPDPRQHAGQATRPLAGEPPSPLAPPSGCSFRERCPKAVTACGLEVPPLDQLEPRHWVACPEAAPAANSM